MPPVTSSCTELTCALAPNPLAATCVRASCTRPLQDKFALVVTVLSLTSLLVGLVFFNSYTWDGPKPCSYYSFEDDDLGDPYGYPDKRSHNACYAMNVFLCLMVLWVGVAALALAGTVFRWTEGNAPKGEKEFSLSCGKNGSPPEECRMRAGRLLVTSCTWCTRAWCGGNSVRVKPLPNQSILCSCVRAGGARNLQHRRRLGTTLSACTPPVSAL